MGWLRHDKRGPGGMPEVGDPRAWFIVVQVAGMVALIFVVTCVVYWVAQQLVK